MADKMIGAVLYHGPSELDGSPIVVVMTGFVSSSNRKTGRMLQTWILRADVDPMQAIVEGADASICGDCPHRRNQGGACYVVPEQAPLSIWRAWQRGRYEDWTVRLPDNALADQVVRFGSYGDPAAVPYRVWRRIRRQKLAGWTGYTHQWRTASARFRAFLMASVDTEAEQREASAAGWRTFRVQGPTDATPQPSEVICPSEVTTCFKCGLCKGRAMIARNVVIPVHGYLLKRVEKRGRLLPSAV